ncbi:MAG TPA: hypothetical protein VGN57_23275 [Pirellulaceae bacterium]|jgi:hypothetical protein|nr:hypothetical protein [Pirellulaceae bacterium]
MLRFLVRRIPRFGFVTLFAAMLLFVSVAGWAKWHLDLWQEEEALLEDLAKAGVDYSYSRGSGVVFETKPGWKQPWSVWHWTPPMLSRIDSIYLFGTAPRELMERAATLPYVRTANLGSPLTIAATMPAEDIARKLGIEPGAFDVQGVESGMMELPHGEPVEASEAATHLSRTLESWDRSAKAPTRGAADTFVVLPWPVRIIQARGEEIRFVANDGSFAIWTPASNEAFVQTQSGFEQIHRLEDPEQTQDLFARASPQMIAFDPKVALKENLEKYGIEKRFQTLLREPNPARVERIGEATYRIDLPTIVVDYPAANCEDAYSITQVVRSDLDWTLEAWDVQGVRTQGSATPPGLPPIASASYRGKLRREGDWIVAEEWVSDWLSHLPAAAPGQPPTLAPYRRAGLARYDFTSEVDLSHVTPERLGARMLPPRRELPWLRWYRVTFGLSLALFAWVAVRKRGARRRVEENGQVAERAAA